MASKSCVGEPLGRFRILLRDLLVKLKIVVDKRTAVAAVNGTLRNSQAN